MRPHVPKREHDRCGFLHAHETPKGPFSVVLLDILGRLDCIICQHVHAVVFTIVDACPTREPKVDRECCPGVTAVASTS